MSVLRKLKFWKKDPYQPLAKDLRNLQGDADALALLPYDDGTFWLKPAHFDKSLIGGQGGYETDDGDKIVLDGDGEPVKQFLGVDIVLGLDPTEHAGAVDPIKSYVAQKRNIGEWIKADKQGNIIEVGEALMPAREEIEVGPETSPIVEEKAKDLAGDGGVMMERAVEELEKEGEIKKIYDLAPPASPTVVENGDGKELELEEATHVAVDQSRAKDLMPTTTSTTELNVALDKARMEEHEPRELKRDLAFLAAGALTAVFFGGLIVAINSFF